MREPNHSAPSSVEVKNGAVALTLPRMFHGIVLDLLNIHAASISLTFPRSFERCPLRNSSGTPAILTQMIRVSSQSLPSNAGIELKLFHGHVFPH